MNHRSNPAQTTCNEGSTVSHWAGLSADLRAANGQESFGPKVGFGDIAIHLLEARLWIVGVWNSIRHVHQTSSRRDADASKQVGEPGIGAKGVPERLYFEVSETIEPLLVSLF